MFSQKPNNSKITEKLKILNKRINSVLIQVYHLKNVLLADDGVYNIICNDPNYEAAIKLLLKKFPNIDIKLNKANLELLTAIHPRILNEFNFHYYTLVDVLEIKDSLMDLFGQISAFQFTLDINYNFNITKCYLDIIANYSTIMIILGNLTQIKTILAVYNFATLSKFDQDERFYHRLCERLVEKHKDGPIFELYNELNPYSKTIINAVNSLVEIVKSKQVNIAEWDKGKRFLLSQPSVNSNVKSMNPALLLPYCQLERWVIFGYLVVFPEILKSPVISQLWRSMLAFSYNVVLFRSELLQIHTLLIKFFESQKGCGKLVSLVRESGKELGNLAIGLHRSRRNYLRMVLRHQIQIIIDTPGTIAPNIMVLSYTLVCATDELHWLVRHSEMMPSKKLSSVKPDDFVDQQLPEYMHQIEDMRFLIQQFNIVDNYYKIVLKDIDLPALQEFLNSLSQNLSEDDVEIFNDFIEKLNNVQLIENEDDGNPEILLDNDNMKPFKDLRLDWCRLQTYLSYNNSNFHWKDNHEFVHFMNSLIIHTELVDNLPKFINRFSTMKFLYFHRAKFVEWFDSNLKLAAQHRYAVVFPRICGQFIEHCRTDCPEDYNIILRSSTDMAHTFLNRICQELCSLLTAMVKTHFELNSQLQACNAVDLYNFHFYRRQAEQANQNAAGKTAANKLTAPTLPGIESKRSDIVQSTQCDMELMALNQLASGLNTRPLVVNNRTFYPNRYLTKELIKFLSERFVTLSNIKMKREKGEPIVGIRRPSVMLIIIKECMNLISKTSEFVNINTSQIFTDVFLRQSLNKDLMGHSTLTEIYCNWYVDYVLVQPHILHTPLLKCFLTITPQSQKEASSILINVEEYTDIEELRALVEVIGPYGMSELSEKIMQMIVKNVGALRRFVLRNRSTLTELNVINLDYNKIKKLLINIEDVDDFCQQWKQMGILFAFKDLCRDAVRDVVRKSMPFLKATVEDLQHDFDNDLSDQMSSVSERDAPLYGQFRNQLVINQLCNGFGLKTKVDSTLFNAIESIKLQQQQLQSDANSNFDQNEDFTNELLIVATSYLLPRLVGNNFYHVEYEALEQSAHCTAYAIKELMYVFFVRYGEERLDHIIRKFIALTSSNLLRLGMETSNSAHINKDETVLIGNRDSIYIFFDFVIQTLENVSDDFYEECFPYALVRQAYHNVVKQSRLVMTKAAHPTEASSKAAIEAYKINSK